LAPCRSAYTTSSSAANPAQQQKPTPRWSSNTAPKQGNSVFYATINKKKKARKKIAKPTRVRPRR
jgi:hypothetical protein